VGGFWYKGEFTNSQQVSIPAFVPTALLVNGQNTTSSENLSGFAHTVWHFGDKLSVNAGVRYSTDKKDEDFDNSIVITQLDTDESHFDWKAGIDYKFTAGMMGYLGIDRLPAAGIQPAPVPAHAVRQGGW
jgi:outer membrane receptor protein involved in Fe transport